MVVGHAPPRRAQRARRTHVVTRGDREHLAAHEPRERGRVHDAERDEHTGESGAEHGAERQREHEGRERQERVHGAHHESVHATARVSGEQTEHAAGRRGERDGDDPGKQRDARAPDDAGEHVAADVVGAEHVRASGPRQRVAEVLLERVVRRQDGCADRHHDRCEQHYPAERRQPRARGTPQRARAKRLTVTDGQGSPVYRMRIRGSSQP